MLPYRVSADYHKHFCLGDFAQAETIHPSAELPYAVSSIFNSSLHVTARFKKPKTFPLVHVSINDFDNLRISGYVQKSMV